MAFMEIFAAHPELAQAAAHSGPYNEQSWWLLVLIPLIPLAGAIVTYWSTFGAKELHRISGWVATAASFASFAVVHESFAELRDNPSIQALSFKLWTWFAVSTLKVDIAFRFDTLTAVMCLVITGIGTLIHLYAIGYMAHDESRPRFFCYLNLFLFAMLILVLAGSLPVLFIGWEGVGLCSYLLIGFWYNEMPNAVAGQKAFVVNRIGDAGFILGMFTLLFYGAQSLDFVELQQFVEHSGISKSVFEIAAILLFIGAVGKSAQIPLFVWLPDAMAGPTPVSALIHAATMVTAGIYLLTRMSFLYTVAPLTLTIVAVIGTLTAFLAATVALVQNDIKKVLAYSTVSQLGFMFMALGSGAFSNGIYHVVTHAFFKACLFMGAGSVIMGCHHEQDMRHYGGLWKKMPLTFLTYLAATLAIAGFPFTSGFFSKDAILWTVFSNEKLVLPVEGFPLAEILWALGFSTAFLTAFYMTRSLVLTFFGKYRGHAHPHESPLVVTLPLVLLAIPSICFGYLFGEELLHFLHHWTRPDMTDHALLETNETYALLEHLSMGLAVFGIVSALIVYTVKPNLVGKLVHGYPKLYRFLLDKWRLDELYALIVVRPLSGAASLLFTLIDRSIIDGLVNGAGIFVEVNSDAVGRIHTGRIGHYALWMFAGNLLLVVLWMLAK